MQGQIALAKGDLEISRDRLEFALEISRQSNQTEQGIQVEVSIAELHFHQGDISSARSVLNDILETIVRENLQLSHADALNLLARIEQQSGNIKKAQESAIKAYELSWCDGPPYHYQKGLSLAREILSELKISEPVKPPFQLSEHEVLDEIELNPIADAQSLTNTQGLPEEEIYTALKKVKQEIEWDQTTGSARKWWDGFEQENQHRPALILQLAEELKSRKTSISEFFMTYVYSNTESIQANLYYLDHSRLKKEEEKNKMGQAQKKLRTAPHNSAQERRMREAREAWMQWTEETNQTKNITLYDRSPVIIELREDKAAEQADGEIDRDYASPFSNYVSPFGKDAESLHVSQKVIHDLLSGVPKVSELSENLEIAISDTTDWTEKQVKARIKTIKQAIGWEEATGSTRKWWDAFEKEYREHPDVVLRLAEELRSRGANISELFMAYVYSNAESITANLCYLDYIRLKKEEEIKKRERANETRDVVRSKSGERDSKEGDAVIEEGDAVIEEGDVLNKLESSMSATLQCIEALIHEQNGAVGYDKSSVINELNEDASDSINFEISRATDNGHARPYNLDRMSVFETPYHHVFIMLSGLGNPISSPGLLEFIVNTLKAQFNYREALNESDIRTYLECINRELIQIKKKTSSYRGVGAIITGHIFLKTQNRSIQFNVGNTRTFILRENTVGLEMLSEDHTVEAQVHRNDGEPRLESGRKPKSHVLTSALGLVDVPDIHIKEIDDVQPDAIYLICSDGLHDVVFEETMWLKIFTAENFESVAETLVSLAYEKHSTDNISAMIYRVKN